MDVISMRFVCGVLLCCAGLLGWTQVNGREEHALPRGMTLQEELIWKLFPPVVTDGSGPPSGQIRCVAEYESMEGLIIAWEGGSTLYSILAQIANQVTNAGQGLIYVAVDTASEQSSASSQLQAAGCNMSRIRFIVVATDSIWCRDYGPRYIYQGNCRAIVDHTYNRPRPLDDVFPTTFSAYKHHEMYSIPLIHGGGNFHLNATNESFVTRLITNENPSISENQIHQLWYDYQRVDTTFYNPFPTSIDATQHIDMWMQVIGDRRVVISDWPNNSGSSQDQICDSTAASLQSLGWTVFRIPARHVNGNHYTYTNVVLFNNLVLIPSYTNTSVSGHNPVALSTWQAAMPGKTILQINSEGIVSLAGVLHCIVMHVPTPIGGANPSSCVIAPNGMESYLPGTNQTIRWITDDDVLVSNVDLHLSLDGGQTFSYTLASAIGDDGNEAWIVPDKFSKNARIRVTARDAQNNTGTDLSDVDFRIHGLDLQHAVGIRPIRCKITGGGLLDIVSSDDQRLTLSSLQSSAGTSVASECSYSFATLVDVPAQMQIRIEHRTSPGSLSGSVFLKHKNTGAYVQVGGFTTSTSDITTTIGPISSSDYIDSQGRVELKIGIPGAAKSHLDWLQIELRPQ